MSMKIKKKKKGLKQFVINLFCHFHPSPSQKKNKQKTEFVFSASGLTEKLLLKPKARSSLQTERVPRSSGENRRLGL